jgi:hypothetical protein
MLNRPCKDEPEDVHEKGLAKGGVLYSLNQKQFVAVMNTSDSTVQKWELGAKKQRVYPEISCISWKRRVFPRCFNRCFGKRNRRGSVFLRRFRFAAASVADGILCFPRA